MNLSKTIVSKKVLFTKRKLKMRKISAIILQMVIFIAAWFVMSPDQLVDNTYIFGLVGSVELVKGNADWVMMTAGILSVFNIWVWWPKVKVIHTTPIAENTKNEAKEIDRDPKTPDLS